MDVLDGGDYRAVRRRTGKYPGNDFEVWHGRRAVKSQILPSGLGDNWTQSCLRGLLIGFVTVAGAVILPMAVRPGAGQTAAAKVLIPGQFPAYRAPRTADGKPDLN